MKRELLGKTIQPCLEAKKQEQIQKVVCLYKRPFVIGIPAVNKPQIQPEVGKSGIIKPRGNRMVKGNTEQY